MKLQICKILIGFILCSCTIGRHDSHNLRIIAPHEWHEMDDKGFPLNLFQSKKQRGW